MKINLYNTYNANNNIMFSKIRIGAWIKNFLDNLFHQNEKALPGLFKKYQRLYWEFRDVQLGREHVGMDKYGNEYYQYYSYFGGLPIKRMVIYKFYQSQHFHNDPHFLGWLNHRQELPPTQEELQYLYLKDAQFKRKGIAWDLQQKIMMEGNKEQRQQLEDQEEEKMSEIPEPNLDEEPKSFQYEEPSILTSSSRAYMESENALLLKDLEEIIEHEEKKIQYYKEKKEEESTYLQTAARSFDRHRKFRETYRDVFLQLGADEPVRDYSLIDKDPDIQASLRNI